MEEIIFPYCVSCTTLFVEHGISVEEGLFGGIIGIVFQEKDDDGGAPPLFFELNFTRISYLFVCCHDELTHQLGKQPSVLITSVVTGSRSSKLGREDVHRLS